MKVFTEAIESVFPQTIRQVCIVHQIRNSLKYISYKDRKTVAADLKPIYTAVSEDEALYSLELFAEKWSSKYPIVAKLWKANWQKICPDVPVYAGNLPRRLSGERHRILELQFK